MQWKQFLTPVESIDSIKAQNLINENTLAKITILDVRQPKEYEAQHLPGSILIPLPELNDRLNELNKEEDILVY